MAFYSHFTYDSNCRYTQFSFGFTKVVVRTRVPANFFLLSQSALSLSLSRSITFFSLSVLQHAQFILINLYDDHESHKSKHILSFSIWCGFSFFFFLLKFMLIFKTFLSKCHPLAEWLNHKMLNNEFKHLNLANYKTINGSCPTSFISFFILSPKYKLKLI